VGATAPAGRPAGRAAARWWWRPSRGAPSAFRTLPERLDVSRRGSTTWRYDLEPVDGGTLVRHSYEITVLPLPPMRALYGVLMPHHRDMRPQMQANLEALRAMFTGAPAA
jgi:hypothetical protein